MLFLEKSRRDVDGINISEFCSVPVNKKPSKPTCFRTTYFITNYIHILGFSSMAKKTHDSSKNVCHSNTKFIIYLRRKEIVVNHTKCRFILMQKYSEISTLRCVLIFGNLSRT